MLLCVCLLGLLFPRRSFFLPPFDLGEPDLLTLFLLAALQLLIEVWIHVLVVFREQVRVSNDVDPRHLNVHSAQVDVELLYIVD